MRRRRFISFGLASAAAAVRPRISFGQSANAPRIGILDPASAGTYSDTVYWSAFQVQMRTLGYIPGSNVHYDYRWADGNFSRLGDLTKDLIAQGVRVILARNTPAALTARSLTTTVPIIVPLMADPVGIKLVASLNRPGGNVTGLSTISAELSAKRLELLREIVPQLSRATIMWDATNPAFELSVRHTQEAARALGIGLDVVAVKSGGDLDDLMTAVMRGRPQGLIVAIPAGASQFGGDFTAITAIVAQQRIPAVYAEKEYVKAGGLSSYGPSYVDLFRRLATYTDKILKGALPADVPVEEPTKFEMALNLKAAKALGITISPMMLTRADETIE